MIIVWFLVAMITICLLPLLIVGVGVSWLYISISPKQLVHTNVDTKNAAVLENIKMADGVMGIRIGRKPVLLKRHNKHSKWLRS